MVIRGGSALCGKDVVGMEADDERTGACLLANWTVLPSHIQFCGCHG